MDRFNGAEGTSPLVQQTPNSKVGYSCHLRSQSVSLGQSHWAKPTSPAQELFRRIRSISYGHGRSMASVSSSEVLSNLQNKLGGEVSSDETDGVSRHCSSSPSVFSVCSDSGSGSVETALTPNLISDGSECVMDLNSSGLSSIKEEDLYHSSPPSVLVHMHAFSSLRMLVSDQTYCSQEFTHLLQLGLANQSHWMKD